MSFGFSYNAAGQLVSRYRDNDAFTWGGHVNVNRNYTTNGLNQYTAAGPASFCYDANGNLTADGASVYKYDVENRLVEKRVQVNSTCTSLSYTGTLQASLRYDPLGRLHETTGASGVITRFLYDGDAMVGEYNSAGTMLRRFVHGADAGADDPLIWFEGTSTAFANARHLYADPRGSIVLVGNSTGAAIAINSYDEYGIPGAGNQGRFQYTGQAWLPELGMYYYKARIYSPTLGRFLQTDPIGYEDQYNLYVYVGNDPVNGVDPTGMAEACSTETGRYRGCVTVDADFDNDGSDDLTRNQLRRIGSDFGGFIEHNRGDDISNFGKPVTGDASLGDKAMTSVVSQFMGSAFRDSVTWKNLTVISAMRSGGPEDVDIYNNGRWQMTLGPNFPSGFFADEVAWFRNTYASPSNLARVMLHGFGHAFLGEGGTPQSERRVDTYARYALEGNGLAGGGCWNAAFLYPGC